MKLRTLGRAMLRRWYAIVAGLLAVGAVSYYLYGAVPVSYKATGSVVLLPTAESVGKGGNPYLFLTGLGQAMDVLSRRVSAPDVMKRLTAGQPSSTYTAEPDVTSGSSILVVTVTSGSTADAQATMSSVLADVPSELKAMQDELKVPPASRISSMQVAEPTAPVVNSKPRLQATAAAGIAGLLLVVLLTALLDGLLLRRSLRVGRRKASKLQEHRPQGSGPQGSGPRRSEREGDEEANGEDESRILVPTPTGATPAGDGTLEFDGEMHGDAKPARTQRRVSSERG